mmetsp:Transcript_65064/g.193983  ORF Transcript_65064/g.193983 Transcript_65064/m.193983 type:complete len:201 (-) Transcript_65064:95-697(-)
MSLTQTAAAPQRSRRLRSGGPRDGPRFCSSFAGLPSDGDPPQALEAGARPCRAGCTDAGCSAQASGPADCGGCGAERTTWTAFFHGMVHPGCAQSHGSFDRGSGSLEAEASEGSTAAANLNLSSALLHLTADVLRGVAILVAAVAIEVGYVSDPGKADAICALAVAAFVALGSVEIVRRLGLAVWRQRSLRRAPSDRGES